MSAWYRTNKGIATLVVSIDESGTVLEELRTVSLKPPSTLYSVDDAADYQGNAYAYALELDLSALPSASEIPYPSVRVKLGLQE